MRVTGILKSLFLAVLIAAVLVPVALAGLNTGGGDWEWVRPDVQGNTISDTDFADASTGWAVGGGGVILKTTDGGATWTSQTPSGSCGGTLGSGCSLNGVDFVDASNGWAVGRSGTIWRTSNGGATWSPQTLPINVDLLSVSFFNANIGMLTSYGKVFYTGNGGASWTQITNGLNTSYEYTSIQMVNSNTAYLAGQSGAIYKTTNSGGFWTAQSSGTSTYLSSVHFIDAQHGFALGGTSLLRTSNGGTSWSKNTTPLPAYMEEVAVAGNNLVAVGSNGTVLRRSNAGNWTDGMDVIVAGMTSVASGTTSFLDTVTFFPGSDQLAIAGGGAGATIKTIDGGASWTRVAGGDAQDIVASSFLDSNTGWMAGEAGLVIKTADRGDTWRDDNAGLSANADIKGLHMLSGTNGFAVGVKGATLSPYFEGYGVIYRYDGTNWAEMTVPAGIGRLISVRMSDDTRGWAVGSRSLALRTSDGGATWVRAADGIPGDVELNSVDTTDAAANGWIAGQLTGGRGVILKYDGANWSSQAPPSAPLFMASIDMIDAITGYAVGSGGKVYKTTDGGTTWSAQNSGTSKVLASVSFLDAGTGFAAGGDLSDSRVIKTTDGGVTWTTEVTGAGHNFITISTIASGTAGSYAAFVGAGSSVLRSPQLTAPADPQLGIHMTDTYWASFADYQARQLTVAFRIVNNGQGAASATSVTGVTATSGVTLSSPMPLALGDLAAGAEANFVIRYLVPPSVPSFRTTLSAKCQDAGGGWHYYPEP